MAALDVSRPPPSGDRLIAHADNPGKLLVREKHPACEGLRDGCFRAYHPVSPSYPPPYQNSPRTYFLLEIKINIEQIFYCPVTILQEINSVFNALEPKRL
jgi:hypothetical protein